VNESILENALSRKNFSERAKFTVKSIVALGIVALALLLPQVVHIAAGRSGGVTWLPMYLPVLLGGCVLGVAWGAGIATLAPVVSFLLTLAVGNPMPAAERLPFIVTELIVIAAVAGLFSKNIVKNGWAAFPAAALALVAGRASFLLCAAVFGSGTQIALPAVWAQIKAGIYGVVAQIALVPVAVTVIRYLLQREK